MQKITIIICLLIGVMSYGQKIKIKKDVVYINKEITCKIQGDKSVRYSFYLNDLNDSKLLYFKWVLVEYTVQIDGVEVEENIDYFEVYMANDLSTILYEERAVLKFKQHMISNLYNADVIRPNGFNIDNLKTFALKKGKEFSRLRKERLH